MPLARFAQIFEGIDHSDPILLVERFAFLQVQSCEVWRKDDPTKKSILLWAYRSPLVDDLDPWWDPARQLLLKADRQEVLFQTIKDDPEMMHGTAEWVVYQLAGPGQPLLSEMCALSDDRRQQIR
ncbi:hypothetical protein MycrhDRAFT_5749 [Mycolicibacterium rhodesiae JS60]|nr:hypothetical protein MycrhDRAFT_5749 [Mycolicibacterium rhodesiae JS60]